MSKQTEAEVQQAQPSSRQQNPEQPQDNQRERRSGRRQRRSAAQKKAKQQDQDDSPEPPRRRLIPVPDWGKYHPWPPIGGLRHLIFHAETNGFSTAFKRVGRRVLVDETAFWRCVEHQNEKC